LRDEGSQKIDEILRREIFFQSNSFREAPQDDNSGAAPQLAPQNQMLKIAISTAASIYLSNFKMRDDASDFKTCLDELTSHFLLLD
jgi:hypothetical protein